VGGGAEEELVGEILDGSQVDTRADEEQDSLVGDKSELNVRGEDGRVVLGLDLQGLSPGEDRAELVKATREDESLEAWHLLWIKVKRDLVGRTGSWSNQRWAILVKVAR